MTTSYQFHPIADKFPLMEGRDFDELVKSIKAKGQRKEIWLFEGKILDGRNRYRACRKLHIETDTVQFKGTLEEAREFVIDANAHRLHLPPGEKYKIIEELLAEFPDLSDREIAKKAKTNPTAVGRTRKRMGKATTNKSARVRARNALTLAQITEVSKDEPEAARKLREFMEGRSLDDVAANTKPSDTVVESPIETEVEVECCIFCDNESDADNRVVRLDLSATGEDGLLCIKCCLYALNAIANDQRDGDAEVNNKLADQLEVLAKKLRTQQPEPKPKVEVEAAESEAMTDDKADRAKARKEAMAAKAAEIKEAVIKQAQISRPAERVKRVDSKSDTAEAKVTFEQYQTEQRRAAAAEADAKAKAETEAYIVKAAAEKAESAKSVLTDDGLPQELVR